MRTTASPFLQPRTRRGFIMHKHALVLSALLAATAGSDLLAKEVQYPSKPITLIVPYPPGGPNDVIARTLSAELSKELKVPVVIENKAGAAGNIGTAAAARAPSDGYTIALPGSALAINTVIFDNLPYKLSDFRAIGLVAQGPVVAVAHPSAGIRSIAELAQAAKARPEAFSFPSGGKGTSPHLGGVLFNQQAQVKMTHVPYKGTGEFVPDLLAGRVPVAFVSPLIARQYVDSGALVALATTGEKRLRGWERVPTVAESGYPGFKVQPWYALVAPAATPDGVVHTLHEALQKALQSPRVQEKLVNLGLDAVPGTIRQADAAILGEAAQWKGIDWSE